MRQARKRIFQSANAADITMSAVYRVALIQTRGSSLVVTHRTADGQVTLDRTVTLGLVPVELSTSISGSHAATYIVNACVS